VIEAIYRALERNLWAAGIDRREKYGALPLPSAERKVDRGGYATERLSLAEGTPSPTDDLHRAAPADPTWPYLERVSAGPTTPIAYDIDALGAAIERRQRRFSQPLYDLEG
jgi:hypothetical protein